MDMCTVFGAPCRFECLEYVSKHCSSCQWNARLLHNPFRAFHWHELQCFETYCKYSKLQDSSNIVHISIHAENTFHCSYKKQSVYITRGKRSYLFWDKYKTRTYKCGRKNNFWALSWNCHRRLLVSSCLSFCLTAWNNSAPPPQWTDFHEIWNLSTFRKYVEKIQVSFQIWEE